ncbi:MAG: ssDNA-binding domain-containing protein [Fimbriimonadaceae bacterium]|nr:ssDNA-binding domain-containing protein [Fimbriimonadaceae bacterium]NUM38786.1 DUF1738 domain-containing protein [Armatimonadota bacterium]
MSSTYKRITESIVKAIEAAGTESLPWRKSWHVPAPCNAQTGRRYKGLNRVVLESIQDYKENRWLTFRQAQTLGGNVRKGERSTAVVLFKETPKDDESERRLLCRTFNVFNIEQIDGLDQPSLLQVATPELHPLEAAQAVLDGFATCPPIRFGGSSACYIPSQDLIRLPRPEHFASPADFFSVAYHEASHATGHSSRLDRFTIRNPQPKGSTQYALEELIAELSSAFLCSEAGIYTESQHVAYLQSWLKCFRDDASFLVRASTAAQRAADYILGRYERADLTEAARVLNVQRQALTTA